MKPLTSDERSTVNRAYHAFAFRGGVHDLYWVDSHRMPCVRKVAGRRRLLPPAGGIHVGRYDGSHSFKRIIEDLLAVMRAHG